jgi:hypothetical protein
MPDSTAGNRRRSFLVRRPLGRAIVAVTGGLSLAALALSAAGQASAAPASAPSWHVVKSITSYNEPEFGPIVATSPTNAWAFEQQAGSAPVAWHLTGTRWATVPFPAKAGDSAEGAAASGPDNVWAFSVFKAFEWNGSHWVVRHEWPVGTYIDSLTVLGPRNVYAFVTTNSVGVVMHFNGTTWSAVPAARGLQSASAISPHDIWAIGGLTVAHFNGSSWARTSLGHLLPKSQHLCSNGLTGIDAQTATNIWVTASGNCQDEGGPLYLLHSNGRAWRRIALPHRYGTADGAVSDGHGGLWLQVFGGSGAGDYLLHYAGGRMHSVSLPVHGEILLLGICAAPHSAVAFLAAYAPSQVNFDHGTGLVLRYGS